MTTTMRAALKRLVRYTPKNPALAAELAALRESHADATVVPPFIGDAIVDLIEKNRFSRCLEVGMATGSTAAYMLRGIEILGSGEVISIDRAQTTHYESIGLRTVERTGLAHFHRLIELDSIRALHDLWVNGQSFDFVFMDGWKTFDHLAAELYVVIRMLSVGGIIMFDDFHMPSVRRAVRMLRGHYDMKPVDVIGPSARLDLTAHALFVAATAPRRAWAALQGPVATLQKVRDVSDLMVTKDWNFYQDF